MPKRLKSKDVVKMSKRLRKLQAQAPLLLRRTRGIKWPSVRRLTARATSGTT
jgi:hypothetical protein